VGQREVLESPSLDRLNDYISISLQMLFLIHLKLFVDRNRTILNANLNMKYRIHKSIDDITFSNQGAMNFTLKFNYVVKNRVVIARKKYFQMGQILLME
jgi:hypothetical protein